MCVCLSVCVSVCLYVCLSVCLVSISLSLLVIIYIVRPVSLCTGVSRYSGIVHRCVLALPVTLCGAARHCLVHRCVLALPVTLCGVAIDTA